MISPIFLSLLACCLSTTYKIEKYYSEDVSCSNYFTSWYVTQVASCSAVLCENLNNNAGRVTDCSASAPVYPDGWVTFSAYQTIDCSDIPSVSSAPLATCTGFWVGSSVQVNCVGTACRVINCGLASNQCGGCPSQDTNGTNVCIQGNPTQGYTMLGFKIVPPPFTTTRSPTVASPPTTAAPTGVPTNSSTAHQVVVALVVIALIAMFV
jgi:hypothetical protein